MLHKPCACSSNQDNLANSCNCTIRANKLKWNICASCSRVLMRSDTTCRNLYLCWQPACCKPCAARNNTKPGDGSKQVQLCSRSCQRSGIDVCAYSDGLDHQTDLQAVRAGCDGMLLQTHAAVFRTTCRQRLLTNSSCKTCWLRMYVCMLCLRV
jgi:hypothetical protein